MLVARPIAANLHSKHPVLCCYETTMYHNTFYEGWDRRVVIWQVLRTLFGRILTFTILNQVICLVRAAKSEQVTAVTTAENESDRLSNGPLNALTSLKKQICSFTGCFDCPLKDRCCCVMFVQLSASQPRSRPLRNSYWRCPDCVVLSLHRDLGWLAVLGVSHGACQLDPKSFSDST